MASLYNVSSVTAIDARITLHLRQAAVTVEQSEIQRCVITINLRPAQKNTNSIVILYAISEVANIHLFRIVSREKEFARLRIYIGILYM